MRERRSVRGRVSAILHLWRVMFYILHAVPYGLSCTARNIVSQLPLATNTSSDVFMAMLHQILQLEQTSKVKLCEWLIFCCDALVHATSQEEYCTVRGAHVQ